MIKNLPFFPVVTRKQSYLNIVYIIFSFPLSILFFSIIVTGISLSLGLLIIFIGLFVFAGTMTLIRSFRLLDIKMTSTFLGLEIEAGNESFSVKGFFNYLSWLLSSRVTWKSFVFYLIIKLPLDIIIFSASFAFIILTLELLFAPLLVEQFWFHDEYLMSVLINYFEDPYVLPFMGIINIFISLHVINGLSWIYRLVNPVFLK